jgi:hypothetical protein
MINHTNLIGSVFGNLEVIGVGKTNKHRKKCLIVKCNRHPFIAPYEVVKQSLINGSTKGCIECKRDRMTTHGKHNTRIYHSYKRIIQRIKDSNDKDFKDYGGRGILIDPKYDPEYQENLEIAFLNFFNDIKNLPNFDNSIQDIPNPYQIDRKDYNGNYVLSNLRLVTPTIQQRNKRNNIVDELIVENIRNDWNTGNYKVKDLSIKYNIPHQHISRIVNNKVWN